MNVRPAIMLIGVVVAFFGLVWLMQGIDILPGSFMTGSQFWAKVGGMTLLIGVAIAASSFRLRKKHDG